MNFLKKLFKKPQPSNTPQIKLAMVLIPDIRSFSFDEFIDTLRTNLIINESESSQETGSFKVDDEQFFISLMPFAIPAEDIENTAMYAYNWPTAVQDLKDYQAHIIVALSSTNNDHIKHFRLVTLVTNSLLKTTDAIGVYDGTQSLLIPKNDYLVNAAAMSASDLPLSIWIYFGLRKADNKNSGYTYGLKAFGLNEIEIIDSDHSFKDIHELLYNVSHYLLMSGIKLNAGETVGGSENEKIRVDFSKAVLVEGDSYKLIY
ncbi:DUF4261 domain-containing protein [Mucilaginibacter kameinonensis]|uniref:DUF4261 domain-containing protein n=1 Tax=Mucilaginibacter kameinonensis TaxID=452286 RepID=UPI000EF83E65|nr:DUF4261 domain-containing protein [Mucilaginibacter kameinonensis]